jgi:two-component sensor histidine kinase
MTNGNPLRYERLKELIKAVERLGSANDLDDVVEIIRSSARRLIGADGVTVILRDGDECAYIEEDAIGPLWKGHNFPMESCISGWAMLHGKTATIPDISQDPRIPFELYADTFVNSMVMVPIRPHDPIGAIGAYWSDVHDPSAEAVEALEMIAKAAATSIENARLVSALSQALAQTEAARDELRHRVKNAFSVSQSLAALSLPPELARGFSSRIVALSRAYELIDTKLTRDSSIALDELVKAELGAYRIDAPARVTIEGPGVTLPNDKAIGLGIVLNELATNALKYGALSTPAGTVSVTWFIEDSHLVLEWREQGGPSVQTAAIESFGSRLLRRIVEGQLLGNITRQLRRDGVFCTLDVPDIASASAPA